MRYYLFPYLEECEVFLPQREELVIQVGGVLATKCHPRSQGRDAGGSRGGPHRLLHSVANQRTASGPPIEISANHSSQSTYYCSWGVDSDVSGG